MGHRYAASDFHGMKDLCNQILDYLGPDDELYYLGDAADRGPDGIRVITTLLGDPRVHYFLGNHEKFLIDAYENNDPWLWVAYNGGRRTYEDFNNLSEETQQYIVNKLKHLPIKAFITSSKSGKQIILSHSGFDIEEINSLHTDTFIWNRDHITNSWTNEPEFQNTIMIHGHTITWTLDEYDYRLNPEKKDNIIWYCNEHKLDIDLGSAFTGKACLVDLDTLEPIYFTIDNFDKKEYNNYIGKGE